MQRSAVILRDCVSEGCSILFQLAHVRCPSIPVYAIADEARLDEVVVIDWVNFCQVTVQVFTFKIEVMRNVEQI
jgi:hypothetical protein